eukprot:1008899-Alexandrium_andersonii.AAC.1
MPRKACVQMCANASALACRPDCAAWAMVLMCEEFLCACVRVCVRALVRVHAYAHVSACPR